MIHMLREIDMPMQTKGADLEEWRNEKDISHSLMCSHHSSSQLRLYSPYYLLVPAQYTHVPLHSLIGLGEMVFSQQAAIAMLS